MRDSKCQRCGAEHVDRTNPAFACHGTMDEEWTCQSYRPYHCGLEQSANCRIRELIAALARKDRVIAAMERLYAIEREQHFTLKGGGYDAETEAAIKAARELP